MRHGRQNGIVQTQFHHVAEPAVQIVLQDPFGKHHHSYGCAGLVVATAFVGTLREEVVLSKAFPLLDGADTARHVHLAFDHVVSESVNGVFQTGVGGWVDTD